VWITAILPELITRREDGAKRHESIPSFLFKVLSVLEEKKVQISGKKEPSNVG
jgi:hypothetical protein